MIKIPCSDTQDRDTFNEMVLLGSSLKNTAPLMEQLKMLDRLFMRADSNAEQRGYVCEALLLVQAALDAFCGDRLQLFVQLEEAIWLRDEGKMHPLFATSDNDNNRARPWITISKLQAEAAAVFEFGCTDWNEEQLSFARRIADEIAKVGLKPPKKAVYEESTIRNWRDECIQGVHPYGFSFIYKATLMSLRDNQKSLPQAIKMLVASCEQKLGRTNGKTTL